MPVAFEASANHNGAAAPEADLRAIGRSLWAKKTLILGPTLLAAAAALFIAGSMTPMYRSEARVLVESNDTVYTRPEGVTAGDQRAADELAVQSQVQLLLSRDLARQVVEDFKLAESEEFGPSDAGSLLKRIMVLIGLSRDPMTLSAGERVIDKFFEQYNVYVVPETRVIAIEFSSQNPETAAKIANGIAERYLERQQAAKQTATQNASGWLASQIDDLSGRVAEAEAKVAAFRSKSNLFLGSGTATITNQQLSDLSTELARVRAQQADAQAKAGLIRETLKAGRPVESLDVANSELIRNLTEQRVALASTIAREARTYLPAHPRMKELQAQIESFDAQIKDEAAKLARAYEKEADLAAERVASIQMTIDAQKKVVGSAGEQEVELRALEREATAQRELLEQFLARYRDAAARGRVEALPADARIIQRATPTNTPYWPKPLAITTLTAAAVFVLLVVGVTASEFMIVPAEGGAVPPTQPPAPRTPPQQPPSSPPPPKTPTPPSAPASKSAAPKGIARALPAALAAAAASALSRKDDAPPVFGKIGGAAPNAPQTEQMEIEAADMRMLGELATHLASMPKSEQGALNILTVAATAAVDPGGVALSLARSLAGAGRKTILVDAGSGSRDFAAALPNPADGGLGELIAGKTSFGQAIQRDRASAAHLIAPGAAGLLNTAAYGRIGVVFNALGLTYDFVVVLSPSAEKTADMKALAQGTGAAILVSNVQDLATTAAHSALAAAGVGDVVLVLTDAAAARPAERAS
jgi:uncharacterized protein involved in exopolysaccharide biosynthesis/Mrp family chromosome partitioning ATPase